MLDNYRWHYDYVRLAWDTGFVFDQYKHPNVDKNKISLVDIDRIVKERDVALVERYISIVIQFILDHDQAEVLDTNFVKMFRMGQLAVEYLLFCKKYLDNTTVLLKKDILKLKEQIKELKLYNEELEAHISTLTKQNMMATFKCDKCLKAFSTEQYLNSHIKRRHYEEHQILLASKSSETDQLHSEIKELKQRLNETEKLLKEKNEIESDKLHKDDTSEIRENFEMFKERVEVEIANLQTEKKSYEQKYNAMFEILLQNKEEKTKMDLGDPRNQTTQTENMKQLRIENTHNQNVIDIKAIDPLDEKKDVDEKIERKLSAFGETIESKITSGLVTIEQQMHTFLDKLQELEANRIEIMKDQISQRETVNNNQEIPSELKSNITVVKERNSPQNLSLYIHQEVEPVETLETSDHEEIIAKPRVKPRTKFSKPTLMTDTKKDETQAKKIKAELDRILSRHVKAPEVKVVKSKTHQEIPDTQSETESDSSESSAPVKESTVVKKIVRSPEKIDTNKLRREICETMNIKLQDMGISNRWKGIPSKTFSKSLEIVQHQATLTKKVHRDFDMIKQSIERSLYKDKDIKAAKGVMAVLPSYKNKILTNVIKIRCKNKKRDKNAQKKLDSVVTIKNRSLYDTDSESDCKLTKNQNIKSILTEDPKVIQSHFIKQSENTDSDLNSIVLSNDEKIETRTKSALKSYASDGSLAKKKVIFDIDGESEEKLAKEKNTKVDSLSDFDLTDV